MNVYIGYIYTKLIILNRQMCGTFKKNSSDNTIKGPPFIQRGRLADCCIIIYKVLWFFISKSRSIFGICSDNSILYKKKMFAIKKFAIEKFWNNFVKITSIQVNKWLCRKMYKFDYFARLPNYIIIWEILSNCGLY